MSSVMSRFSEDHKKEMIRNLNEIRRISAQRTFTRMELTKTLQKIDVGSGFLSYLIKNSRFTAVRVGHEVQYSFKQIEFTVRDFENYLETTYSKSKSTRKEAAAPASAKIVNVINTIINCIKSETIPQQLEDACIRLLKAKNYQIRKIVTTYKEV